MAPNRTVAPSDEEMMVAIAGFITTHHRFPQVREFTDLVGLKSPSSGHRHLRHLRNSGFITWEDGRPGTARMVTDQERGHCGVCGAHDVRGLAPCPGFPAELGGPHRLVEPPAS